MLFPKSRMKFATTYQGETKPEGWIVLDLAGADIEGVTKIYISMTDAEAVRQSGDAAANRLKQARALLGAMADDEAENE